MTEFKTIELVIEDAIATLTINQPKSLNALTTEVLSEIGQAIEEVENNLDIRALIITGAGEKSFVAGANIVEMKDKNALEGEIFGRLGNEVFYKLSTLRQPTIAAVNGFALGGGCELAMACDIRLASENALFGQPEVGLGITPGFGGTQRLARLVGPGIAKELIYSARNVKAAEAKEIGLVNRVVALEELLPEAKKLAEKIAKQAPLAVEKAKEMINKGLDLPLAAGIDVEVQGFGLLFSTEDQKAGMTAFVNKEKATFNRK
ncbi:enoyl-CoA hydratase-related protein [Ignavigranum ruoffiae]|uniref:enoyl-CoA hydratase-related protein n=1 Tax=Ignavigranum ruoffiae TaxID=89093 RepID=UPI002052FB24|nr:enoyl-CoA hydratase-related protein [Ignavigranum ruoffiae]UPQ84995.1 enoyl-CoA hydratase-related protein [Ignavigranum ruoffiae]